MSSIPLHWPAELVWHWSPPVRKQRVTLLLTVISLMSLADLAATWRLNQTIPIGEMNPLVAALLAAHNLLGLVFLKLFTTGVFCGVLWVIRRRAATEKTCWIVVAAMTLLLLHWGHVYLTVWNVLAG